MTINVETTILYIVKLIKFDIVIVIFEKIYTLILI